MFASSNGLRNPLGFLIHAVPKCFVGESFQLYRKAQQQRREAEAAERRLVENEAARLRLDLESILADPAAPEEEKAFARQTLAATSDNTSKR